MGLILKGKKGELVKGQSCSWRSCNGGCWIITDRPSSLVEDWSPSSVRASGDGAEGGRGACVRFGGDGY